MNHFAYRLLAATALSLSATPAVAQVAADGSTASEEEDVVGSTIVVTANKRIERLIDLPISVSVVQTENLAATGQLKFEDYAAQVPGLVVNNFGATGFGSSVTLRGIGGSYGSGPTVAIYVNDIPFNNSTRATQGYSVPDLDPSDFERIEVLRGPQGTLYGGGTVGGVIKYVAKNPNYDAFSGRVEVGGTTVAHGNQGFSVRGSVNAPLGEDIALRVSSYFRRDAGFIDNLTSGKSDVNQQDKYGGRVVLGVRLTDDVTARIEGYLEHSKVDGNPVIDISRTTLQPLAPGLSNRRSPNTDDSERDAKLVALHLDADLGFADLVSVTGYSKVDNQTNWDYSAALSPALIRIFRLTPPVASRIFNRNNSEKVTQELRLSSPAGQNFAWQIAGFYTHESADIDQRLFGQNFTSGETISLPTLGNTDSKQNYEELAVYANTTYKFNDSFDLSAGIRYSDLKQDGVSITDGVLLGGLQTNPSKSSESLVTYMVSPTFHFAEDTMAYFRIASGYRPGGSNLFVPGTPESYGADKATNYELGIKTEALNRTLSLDLAAFYIAWDKIQIFGLSPLNTSFIFNGGKARSQGIEASWNYRPTEGLSLSGNLAYTDAVLTRDLPPPNVGVKGDPLPGVSKFSGLISADYSWYFAGDWEASIGASYRHVGKRFDNLEAGRYTLPSYDTVDLRAGISNDRYSVNLFVTNLTDERGQLNSFAVATERRVILNTPRTIGISLSTNF